MNKCIFVGNLTRDPDFQQTGSGVSYCRFSIAVNRNYTNANGEREADFINIVTWRGLADRCNTYLRKGNKIGVVGSMQTRSYDANDGTKRFVTEIVADDVEFLTPKGSNDDRDGDETPVYRPKKKPVADLEPVENDDLPF